MEINIDAFDPGVFRDAVSRRVCEREKVERVSIDHPLRKYISRRNKGIESQFLICSSAFASRGQAFSYINIYFLNQADQRQSENAYTYRNDVFEKKKEKDQDNKGKAGKIISTRHIQ